MCVGMGVVQVITWLPVYLDAVDVTCIARALVPGRMPPSPCSASIMMPATAVVQCMCIIN